MREAIAEEVDREERTAHPTPRTPLSDDILVPGSCDPRMLYFYRDITDYN